MLKRENTFHTQGSVLRIPYFHLPPRCSIAKKEREREREREREATTQSDRQVDGGHAERQAGLQRETGRAFRDPEQVVQVT